VIANIQANFTTFLEQDCSSLGGSILVSKGSCINIEDFPYQSYSFNIISGQCEDYGEDAILYLSSQPACGPSDMGTYALTADPVCLNSNQYWNGSVQSVVLRCEVSD
jgi:hypothetical protein